MPTEEALARGFDWQAVTWALAMLPQLLAWILVFSAGILRLRRRPRWPAALLIAGGGSNAALVAIYFLTNLLRAAGIRIDEYFMALGPFAAFSGAVLFAVGFTAHALVRGKGERVQGPSTRERASEKSA